MTSVVLSISGANVYKTSNRVRTLLTSSSDVTSIISADTATVLGGLRVNWENSANSPGTIYAYTNQGQIVSTMHDLHHIRLNGADQNSVPIQLLNFYGADVDKKFTFEMAHVKESDNYGIYRCLSLAVTSTTVLTFAYAEQSYYCAIDVIQPLSGDSINRMIIYKGAQTSATSVEFSANYGTIDEAFTAANIAPADTVVFMTILGAPMNNGQFNAVFQNYVAYVLHNGEDAEISYTDMEQIPTQFTSHLVNLITDTGISPNGALGFEIEDESWPNHSLTMSPYIEGNKIITDFNEGGPIPYNAGIVNDGNGYFANGESVSNFVTMFQSGIFALVVKFDPELSTYSKSYRLGFAGSVGTNGYGTRKTNFDVHDTRINMFANMELETISANGSFPDETTTDEWMVSFGPLEREMHDVKFEEYQQGDVGITTAHPSQLIGLYARGIDISSSRNINLQTTQLTTEDEPSSINITASNGIYGSMTGGGSVIITSGSGSSGGSSGDVSIIGADADGAGNETRAGSIILHAGTGGDGAAPGTVSIRGGHSNTCETVGDVTIAGGDSTEHVGGRVTIQGGVGNVVGGDVVIYGGNGTTPGDVRIYVGGESEIKFSQTEGGIVFPDNSVQTTAYTGGGSDGLTTGDIIEYTAPPTNSYGSNADIKGKIIVSDDNYNDLYVCYKSYDAEQQNTPIWSRYTNPSPNANITITGNVASNYIGSISYETILTPGRIVTDPLLTFTSRMICEPMITSINFGNIKFLKLCVDALDYLPGSMPVFLNMTNITATNALYVDVGNFYAPLLTTLSFPNARYFTGQYNSISLGLPSLTSLSLSNVVEIHNFETALNSMSSLSLPSLTKISGKVGLQSTTLTSISMPSLESAFIINFNIMQFLTSLTLTNLTTITNYSGTGFNLSTLPLLTSLSLPAFVQNYSATTV